MPVELNIDQRSDLWYRLRSGCLTGSGAPKMLTGGTKGEEFGVTAMKYATELLVARIGADDADDDLDTYEMRLGREREPLAIAAYDDRMFTKVRPGGFIGHDTLPAACSPDGHVRDSHGRGILEVKCRKPIIHTSYWLSGQPNRVDMQQIQFNLWITGADFCDFVAFNPDVREDLQLFIARVAPHAETLMNISLRAMKYLAMVDDMGASLGLRNWKPLHLRPDELREELDRQAAAHVEQ